VLVIFRVALGVLFLSVWASNLDKGLYDPGPYGALINGYADEGEAPGFWKELMRAIAANAPVFSKLQLAGDPATEATGGMHGFSRLGRRTASSPIQLEGLPELEHTDSAGRLVDAIGRSDHSVLYQLQPSSAPPVIESRPGSRRAANVRNRAYAIVHKSGVREPQSRMNRAIARPSSPIVVFVEQACHAGGRGFESRRSRLRSTSKSAYLVA